MIMNGNTYFTMSKHGPSVSVTLITLKLLGWFIIACWPEKDCIK